MSTTAPTDESELFDDPSAWREQAIQALGLMGDDRCAGAATSPAMPQLIDAFAERLSEAPAGAAVDVGAGLGPVSWWLTRRTGHRFVPVDPSATSCTGAFRLFGLSAVQAPASSLPFPAGTFTATLLNGVVSLLDELTSSVGEAVRITRPGGLVVIADLTATGDQRVTTDTNTFWTVDELVGELSHAGCEVDYYACCEPGIGRWADIQSIVQHEIVERHADDRGFDEWRRDNAQIGSLTDAGRIAGTCMIARVPS